MKSLRKSRSLTITVSIFLHVLLFVLWAGALKLNLFATDSSRIMIDINPLVFELEPAIRQVIETPDDAETVEQQKEADFLSDKNALARNQESEISCQHHIFGKNLRLKVIVNHIQRLKNKPSGNDKNKRLDFRVFRLEHRYHDR